MGARATGCRDRIQQAIFWERLEWRLPPSHRWRSFACGNLKNRFRNSLRFFQTVFLEKNKLKKWRQERAERSGISLGLSLARPG